jgi:hypothetical protein
MNFPALFLPLIPLPSLCSINCRSVLRSTNTKVVRSHNPLPVTTLTNLYSALLVSLKVNLKRGSTKKLTTFFKKSKLKDDRRFSQPYLWGARSPRLTAVSSSATNPPPARSLGSTIGPTMLGRPPLACPRSTPTMNFRSVPPLGSRALLLFPPAKPNTELLPGLPAPPSLRLLTREGF